MSDELRWESAVSVAERIRSGELSSREALQAHWDRIDAYNPAINAVIYEDRDSAWEAARIADESQAAGERLGPLHGVPLTNKDTNETAGMPNTWGTPLLQHVIPKEDSLIVGRIRAAGAILTGKNNVPEFAAGAHTFNPLFGATGNPFNPALSPGGSSGGAAAAIAAGIQPVGDGSDMGGSLRVPASFCNLHGLRPSLGRIPDTGANSWAWLGRTGPMAREVGDMKLLMEILSGPDPRMPISYATYPLGARRSAENILSGLRIGWSPDLGLGLPVDPRILKVAESALQVFVEAGAQIEIAAPRMDEADLVFRDTRAFDYAFGWGDLVQAHPDEVKPEVVENVVAGMRQTSAELRALAAARTRLEHHTRDYFDRFDVWLTPTAQVLPFPKEWEWPQEIAGTPMVDYLDWMRSVCVVSAMGTPALSFPAGFAEGGLPVGLQLIAPAGADELLLEIAEAFESRTGWGRIHPRAATAEGRPKGSES